MSITLTDFHYIFICLPPLRAVLGLSMKPAVNIFIIELTLLPTSLTVYYGDVVEFTCQADITQAQLVWFTNIIKPHPNNITTQFTSTSTRSVLKISAVPIKGDGTITIICILPPFTIKTANLTIRGTVNH